MDKKIFLKQLVNRWEGARWNGIERPYSAEDVWRLAGSFQLDYSLARHGADKLWQLMQDEDYVAALSAVTGNQAVQEVKAGLKSVYVSGWQVAGDANTAGEIYPDLSLYPADSVPNLVGRLNRALMRADQIHHLREDNDVDWIVPIVADAEAGFGGVLNAYEIMKHMIESGAAGVHFEDQLASLKKCGHLGGKVLVSSREAIRKLVSARLAADVCGVETILIARTDALSAKLLSDNSDPLDREFITGERSPEGFWHVHDGIEAAIARGLAYAPYADLIWFETSTPDITEAQRFSEEIHAKFPGKLLSYNCSPSFNWKRHLSQEDLESFQRDLGTLGYRYQFVTLSGFHALNHATFSLAREYAQGGMAAYSALQEREFADQAVGYEAVKHQEFVGAGYFDEITQIVSGGESSTLAMTGSTEEAQFQSTGTDD